MDATSPLRPESLGFVSTHWTTIRACAGDNDLGRAAREEMCRRYWYPLYAYIRRWGHDGHHAEDLTQDFFADILSRPWFALVDQSKGNFRSFLLASLRQFLRGEFDRKNARKRGGTYQHVPYDLAVAESRYSLGGTASLDPAELYDLEWANSLVADALAGLEAEYTAANKRLQYEHLKSYLAAGGEDPRYEVTATLLGISIANVKVCVHRLRVRYRALLEERVAATVETPEDVRAEMLHLRAVLLATT